MYSNLVQNCFDHCVNGFESKSLTSREESCVMRCVDKHMKGSQRLGDRFQEQNAAMALSLASHGYILEVGKVVMDRPADVLARDDDVREFYFGFTEGQRRSYRDVKHYRRKKRWLS